MIRKIFALLVLFLASSLFCGCEVLKSTTSKAPTQQEQVFASVEGKTYSAVTPTIKADRSWIPHHNRINDQLKKGDVDLLYIGDSITEGWSGAGRAIWRQYYAPRKAVNMGIGGDRTEHVLWRIDNSDFSKIDPKLAIVMIGTNNSNDNTAEEIADGIILICKKLRTRLLDMKILLLAIFPRDETQTPRRDKIYKASEIASQIADDKTIFYMDINKKFLADDGVTLPSSIMPDYLHPNAAGYKIWAEAIEPKVAELMGE